jgi:cell division protein FtsI (penicillin-binding protein 3)
LRDAGGRQFLYLKRHLSPSDAQVVVELEVPGIYLEREYRRYYPTGAVAGHVVGFTNIDEKGQEGLELAFDQELTGAPGRTRVMQDRVGHIVDYVEQLSPPQPGKELRISLDMRIQYLAHRSLLAAFKYHKAQSASLVALDANTGEILAMVNAPDFNPNDGAERVNYRVKNRAITDAFEPGSTIKPVTIAMALQRGLIDVDSEFDTSPGRMFVGRNSISDTSNYGLLRPEGVIVKSSNVGAVQVAFLSELGSLMEPLSRLGFGSLTGVRLPGEQSGNIPINRKNWKEIEHATISYGHGFTATTLQLAQAYTAFANRGLMLSPTILPRTNATGVPVFKSSVIDQMVPMLENVTSDIGTASLARVDSYRVAGKTGTVERLVDGGYAKDSYTSVFAGFAPADDPDIVMVVVVHDPRGEDYFGGAVAAPVFSAVMKGALRLRNIRPAVEEQLWVVADEANLVEQAGLHEF